MNPALIMNQSTRGPYPVSHPDPQFDPADREFSGVYFDMPTSVYRTIRALSWSGTNHLEESPAHLEYNLAHPLEQTEEMELGEQVHCGLLEEERFVREYTAVPKELVGMNKNRNDWKAWVAEVEGGGQKVIKDKTLLIVNAVRANEDWKRLMSGAKTEVSIFWTDPASGAKCKGRLDIMTPGLVIADPKTTSKPIHRRAFGRHMADRNYHRQAAMYVDGLSTILGKRLNEFIHVAISTKPPFSPETSVMFYRSPAAALDLARAELAPLMKTYAECSASGVWPGLPSGIQEIDLPSWRYAVEEESDRNFLS